MGGGEKSKKESDEAPGGGSGHVRLAGVVGVVGGVGVRVGRGGGRGGGAVGIRARVIARVTAGARRAADGGARSLGLAASAASTASATGIVRGRLHVLRYQHRVEHRLDPQLVLGEIEERRQLTAARQSRALFAQLVEERVRARLQRRHPQRRRILQQSRYQVHRLRWRTRPEHLQKRTVQPRRFPPPLPFLFFRRRLLFSRLSFDDLSVRFSRGSAVCSSTFGLY